MAIILKDCRTVAIALSNSSQQISQVCQTVIPISRKFKVRMFTMEAAPSLPWQANELRVPRQRGSEHWPAKSGQNLSLA